MQAATNKFSGTLHIEGKESVALSMTNMLLRGSSLRNTEYLPRSCRTRAASL
jgi:hypothetical protein